MQSGRFSDNDDLIIVAALVIDNNAVSARGEVSTSSPELIVAEPTRRGARVLVIDDEPAIGKAFRRVLGKHHTVTVAVGGEEALRILEQDTGFDVIVCDLMMPQIDGQKIYETLQERASHLSDKIVLCSGGAFTRRAKEFVSSVKNTFLDKPLRPKLLLSVVDQVVARSELEGQ